MISETFNNEKKIDSIAKRKTRNLKNLLFTLFRLDAGTAASQAEQTATNHGANAALEQIASLQEAA